MEDKVNGPRQQESHNCGLFAFAYIWCIVSGLDIASLPDVGDELRLSLLHLVLMLCRFRAAQPAESSGRLWCFCSLANCVGSELVLLAACRARVSSLGKVALV